MFDSPGRRLRPNCSTSHTSPTTIETIPAPIRSFGISTHHGIAGHVRAMVGAFQTMLVATDECLPPADEISGATGVIAMRGNGVSKKKVTTNEPIAIPCMTRFFRARLPTRRPREREATNSFSPHERVNVFRSDSVASVRIPCDRGLSMSWRAQTSAAKPWPRNLFLICVLEKLGAVSLIVGTVHGCSPILPPFVTPEPFDVGAPAPATHYRSTIGSYVSQRPVQPGSWKEQNAQLARSSEQARHGGSEHEH